MQVWAGGVEVPLEEEEQFPTSGQTPGPGVRTGPFWASGELMARVAKASGRAKVAKNFILREEGGNGSRK